MGQRDPGVGIPPALQAHAAGRLQEPLTTPLTSREREITCCVARGMRNIEVARRLYISEQTVKTHLNNIFQKLQVRDRVEPALYAARVALVGLDETPRRPPDHSVLFASRRHGRIRKGTANGKARA